MTQTTNRDEAEQDVAALQQLVQEKDGALAELRHQNNELIEQLSRTRLNNLEECRLQEDTVLESRNELSVLRHTVSELRKEKSELSSQLDSVHSTPGWYWSVKYSTWRKQGIKGLLLIALAALRLLLVFPFWFIRQLIPELYRTLVPSKLRVAFWKFRQRRRRRARRGQVITPAMVMSGSEPTAAGSSAAKDVKDIYIFAMIPYYDIGGGQRAAQLAKTFNKMGYAVHYIYAFPSSDTGKRDPFVPAVRHVHAKDLTPADVVANLHGEPIFIFEAPYKDYEPYLDLADKLHAKTIYEHIDNWESSIGSLFYSETVFRKFLNRCDILVATTQLLAQRMSDFMRQDPELARKADEVIYVPNAVDTDLFDPMLHHQRPHDLSSGTPTLLYFGSLWGEWFDWELIRQVARQVPGCSINLIGDYSPIASLAKTLPPNVHFLGPKLQPELPAYLEHCDITLLPFKNDDIGKYVSPLKVFEYTAMGKPVLATHLPDIRGYPKVFTSDSALDWVRVVRGEIPIESAAANAFSSANNWYTRCNRLLDSIEAGVHELPRDRHISIVILNHNNRGIIERCIDSMLQFRDRYGYEIIVVDNQSSDGSYELLQDRYADHVLLIRNTRNGCSSGRNLGIQHANGNLLLFVDSDQWAVSQRWLDTPLTVLERHRHIGAVGWTCGWFDRDMVGGPIAPNLPHGGIEPAQVYRSDIAYLGSGGMLVRREALSGSRSFDEAYDPTCYEDTDLSLQIRDQGYDLAYCPYMNLNHLPHQTTKYGSDSHWKLVERNGAYFEHKWRKRNPRLLQFYLDSAPTAHEWLEPSRVQAQHKIY